MHKIQASWLFQHFRGRLSEAKELYYTVSNLNVKIDACISGFSKFSVVIYFSFAD